MRFVAIIPARYASTRFPAKPLALLGGKTVIRRVYEQVKGCVDRVVVATDHELIFKEVANFGGEAVMTSPLHRSGTDRCAEAYNALNEDFDVVVNLQGDEPFIQPEQIQTLKNCFNDNDVDIATLVKPFGMDDGIETLKNPNSPKVVVNEKMQALYFSRSVIPFIRDTVFGDEWLKKHTFYKHIGIYAYKADVLNKITQLPQAPLELAESLEQLRWIYYGYKIKVGLSNVETIGIDTPDDLKKAECFLEKMKDGGR